MIGPARRASYDALRAVSTGRRDLADAVVAARESLTDDRDRALATSIVTGTVRWRNRLDWLLARAVNRDLGRLDPEVLDILRLALFQLLFLTRVPASAVVDDAVSLVRASGKTSASGLANAVLRKLARSRPHLDLPPQPEPAAAASREAWVDALSITGSHPRWLIERWLDRMGPEATATWVAFNNEEPRLTVRANTLRITRDHLAAKLLDAGVETRPLRFASDGLEVLAGNPLRTALAEAGVFVVQDEASQLVPLMAGAAPRQRTLDACAAPGGKTLVLAAGPARDGLLVAADRRRRRIALLRERLAAAGAARVRLVTLDLIRGAPFGPVFDLVLVDAPCTGLGTIRRDVDIRWRQSTAGVAKAAGDQRQMLDEAARIVVVGGRLVYATCSSEPDENQEVVTRFLETHHDYAQASRADIVNGGVPEAVVGPDGALVTRPDLHGLEAFFAVALDRRR